MHWKRWLISCTCLSVITVLMTLVMTRTLGTMYTDEINKELHISLPSMTQPIFGVTDNVYKPETVSGQNSDPANESSSIPAFSQISNERSNAKQQLITPEKLVEIKQHLAPDDKLKIYSLITSKVPPEDIQKISLLLENGITTEKLSTIETILKQHLNEQEYSKLTSIFSKY